VKYELSASIWNPFRDYLTLRMFSRYFFYFSYNNFIPYNIYYMTPNLFQFATSELSQDAFFCWLLAWSQEKYKKESPELYKRSRAFIDLVRNEDLQMKNVKVQTVEIKKQYKKIDFLAIINNEIVILFEDKIRTKNHGKQLERYSAIIEKEFKDLEILKVYLKTEYVWKKEKESVESKGFQIIDINDIKSVLLPDSKNDIYDEYYQYIINKIKLYESYGSTPSNHWEYGHWIGFYYAITNKIDYSNFDRY